MQSLENTDISIKRILLKKASKPSNIALLIIGLFSLLTYKYWIVYPDYPFHNDVDQYYSYLVAQLVHHDLGFNFPQHYWLTEAPNHQLVPKATMGMSLMYLPFFVIADNIAYSYDYESLGYSAPYGVCIHFGTLFYALMGLWYTRKSLLLFFNEWITALSLLLILFGTNLFYYVYREGEMPHSYLFFLFSVFMYHAIQWNTNSKNKHLYFMSFIAGFVALIRPTDVMILLIPLLYKVTSFKDLKLRFVKLGMLKWRLIIAVLLFLTPIIPQLIYWKVYTGQLFFFSYGNGERFFFNDPQIINVLFSWRKGWFIYTPIMFFAILGLFIMAKKWKEMFVPIFVYLVLNIYIISSWWDWGFGGSHGMRALIQSYAFLIFPLAFFINWIFTLSKKWLKYTLITVLFPVFYFLCYLNVLQVWQFKNWLLHWDSMTKDAYMYSFMKKEATGEERKYLESLMKHPNYEENKKGNRDE